ncbi:MAG: FAD-dependent oxidoreductase [Kiritimatiellia bacterium]
MINEKSVPFRNLKSEALTGDLVVTGGGLAGVCCALTAARQGLRVVLIQDRPVLGGNASSEVRLWALGATSHMGNNNRWAREGGIVDEILVENTFRNPEGNPLLFDALLLDKVAGEPNIRLLLNTAVFQVVKGAPDTIASVRAFCSQSSMMYEVSGPLFCDASGDGIVAFQAGAAFRIGAESREEFGEKFAPDAEYGELLGHTLFFYSKDTGRPVTFVPPAFALDDITKIPRFGHIAAVDQGCAFWWLEYGGRLDTVHETEKIKWELCSVVYGVWNHIKNSGKFPEAANLTLEWVGMIPGKRESCRFEGDTIMIQQDVIEQRAHADAVAFGGWAIDLHPADGVQQAARLHPDAFRGVYQIPYRSLYSRNLSNLFLAGRIISVSHVAFGSTCVMATTGHTAQAVGMAAAVCRGRCGRETWWRPHGCASCRPDCWRWGITFPAWSWRRRAILPRTPRPPATSRFELDRLPARADGRAGVAAAMLVPAAGPMCRAFSPGAGRRGGHDLGTAAPRVGAPRQFHAGCRARHTRTVRLAKGGAWRSRGF